MKDSEPWLPPLASLSDSQFRERLARCLFDMFEMRTSRPWDRVGEEGAYPDMHTDWLDCADELIERMSSNGPR